MLKRFMPYIVCFSAALFFAYELLQLHMMNAIAPMLMRDLNLSATSFGYVTATYLLADVIFLLPAGIILDRFSTRKVILVALSICIIGTIGFGAARTLTEAAISHFLSGIGNAFCFLSCIMLITRWFPPHRRARIIGLIVTIGMLGAMLAGGPFSLLAEYVGWRQALLIDAGIGTLILGLIALLVSDRPKGALVNEEKNRNTISFWSGIKLAIANPVTLSAGLYTSLLNLPLMVISAVWASLFLIQIHGIAPSLAALISSMISFGTIIGSPLYGILSDQLGDRPRWMRLGAILSALTMVLILITPSSAPLLAFLFFALGLFTSSQVLGYPTITENSPPALTGTSMGIAAVIIMGLPMLIQPLTGALMDHFWNGMFTPSGARLYPFQSFAAAFSLLPCLFLLAILLTPRPTPTMTTIPLST